MIHTRLNKYHIIILCILTPLIIMYLSGIILENDNTIYAVDGVIDLRQIKNFTLNAIVGEAELYPNKHINYGEFNRYKDIRLIEEVPSVWNDKMDGFGIATYRFKIKLPRKYDQLALKVLPLSTSFRIMIDDKTVMESGEVGVSQEKSSPKYSSDYVLINPENDEFELIVHISNFVYSRGGMWKQIILGEYKDINNLEKQSIVIQTIIITLMITMVIFQIFMYIASDAKISNSLIFCTIGILLRLIVTGEYVVLDIVDLPFRFLIILEYLSLYLGFVAWGFFLKSLFKDEFNMKIIKLILYISLGLFLFTILTPIHIFTRYVAIFRLFDVICCIYYVCGILKALKHKKEFSKLLLYSTYVVVIALFTDRIQYSKYNVMSTYGALVYAGCFLLFVFSYIPLSNYITVKKEMKDREFKMLSAQSNPHFLFNALNSIASLSLKGGVEAYDAIICFSDYLKATYTTSNYNNLIHINEELNLIEKYLQTEKLRFKNRLEYEIDMDDIKGIKIYPLLIQPLVENAVKHGVSKNEDGGKIILTGKQYEDYIVITVVNTGSHINNIDEIFKSKGIGIKSVNRKLHNLGSKLEIISEEMETKISMTINNRKLIGD